MYRDRDHRHKPKCQLFNVCVIPETGVTFWCMLGPRDRDHRHKEVHWPPPLIVPEHLEDVEVPDSFKCPITFGIMKEPATTRSGMHA
jgi:hypothetical protein